MSSRKHSFVVILDDEPYNGHIFGTLKIEVPPNWLSLERRCQLCHKTPLALLSIDNDIVNCKGLRKERDA